LFPPEEGVNFDFAHIDNVAMPITPDVLLLPSKLRYFAKVRLYNNAPAMSMASREILGFSSSSRNCELQLAYPPGLYPWPVSSPQDVNGTLVLNPGRLTKFRSGGTYGHLRIDAPRRNDIPTNNEPLRAGVSERATVQIRRI
jgi:DNA polymerase alpha subunit B